MKQFTLAFCLLFAVACASSPITMEQYSAEGQLATKVTVDPETYARSCSYVELTEEGDVISYQRQAENERRSGVVGSIFPSIMSMVTTIFTGPLEAFGLIEPAPIPEPADKQPPTCHPKTSTFADGN